MSAALDSQAVTIDTAAPTATVDITAIADDTGASSSDFITSDTVLTVSGTNTALVAGETVQISSDGGTTWVAVTQDTATTWSYADPAPHATSFTYQARVVDTAGNAGPLDSQAVTIDTAAPTATVDITAIADDTGTSSSDFITSDTVLTVSGTNTALVAGETVQISSDGGTTWVAVTQDTATTWSYADPAPHATSFSYQARVVDTAGNAGPLDSQAVTIDTAAPTATVDITAIADDTGTSSSDFITSDTVLTVSGTNTALGAGETVQISSDGGTTWVDVTQHRHDLELRRSGPARHQLHLSGAGGGHGGQCRPARQPGGHHRYGGADGDGRHHGDCRRHRRVIERLHHQRHRADGVWHQHGAWSPARRCRSAATAAPPGWM